LPESRQRQNGQPLGEQPFLGVEKRDERARLAGHGPAPRGAGPCPAPSAPANRPSDGLRVPAAQPLQRDTEFGCQRDASEKPIPFKRVDLNGWRREALTVPSDRCAAGSVRERTRAE
jgi:hypothetical protein